MQAPIRNIEFSRDLVIAKVASVWGAAAVTDVMRALDAYLGDDSPEGRARVQLAVLKVVGDEQAKIPDLVAAAQRDFRDVVAWAEYPEELRSPTWRLPAAEQARIRTADRAQYLAWLAAHGA